MAESHKLHSKTFRPLTGRFDPKSIKRAVTLLRECGMNANCIDEKGKTPLLYTTQYRPAMVEYLLDASADADFRDRYENNAFHWCKDVCVMQLLAKEVKPNINQKSSTRRLRSFHSAMANGMRPISSRCLFPSALDVTSVGWVDS